MPRTVSAVALFLVCLFHALAETPLAMTVQTETAGSVNCAAVSRDGNLLARGNEDGSIDLIDTRSGKLLRTLRGHTKAVTAVALSSDGKTLISGSRDWDSAGQVIAWDPETGAQVRRHRLLLLPGGRVLPRVGGVAAGSVHVCRFGSDP